MVAGGVDAGLLRMARRVVIAVAVLAAAGAPTSQGKKGGVHRDCLRSCCGAAMRFSALTVRVGVVMAVYRGIEKVSVREAIEVCRRLG